jgi:hypothetical protein
MIAVAAAALVTATALAALAAPFVLLLAVLLAQGLLVSRWFVALGVPGGGGGAVVAGGAALAADLLVVLRDERRALAPVAGVLGVAMLAALIHQLVRRDGRPGVTASMAATTALAVVAVLGAGHLGARLGHGGSALVVAAVLAAGAVSVLAAVPLPGPRGARPAGGIALGVGLGVVTGLLSDLGAGTGALVALGCAVAAAVGALFAGRMANPDPIVCAVLPLLLAGPVGLALGRLLVG